MESRKEKETSPSVIPTGGEIPFFIYRNDIDGISEIFCNQNSSYLYQYGE